MTSTVKNKPVERLATQSIAADSCRVTEVKVPTKEAIRDLLERSTRPNPAKAAAVAKVEVCATTLAPPSRSGPQGVNLRAGNQRRVAEPPQRAATPATPATPAAPPAERATPIVAHATAPDPQPGAQPGAEPGAQPGAQPGAEPGAQPGEPAALTSPVPNAGVDNRPGPTPAGTIVTVTTKPEHIGAAMERTLLESFRNHPNAEALLAEVRNETGNQSLTFEQAAAAMVTFMRERNKDAPLNADGSVTWNINVADAQVLANTISTAGGAEAPVMLAHMMMSNYVGAETERIGRESNLTPDQVSELVTQQLVATRNDHGTPTSSREMVRQMSHDSYYSQAAYFDDQPYYQVEEQTFQPPSAQADLMLPDTRDPHRIDLSRDDRGGQTGARARQLAAIEHRAAQSRSEYAKAQLARNVQARDERNAEIDPARPGARRPLRPTRVT